MNLLLRINNIVFYLGILMIALFATSCCDDDESDLNLTVWEYYQLDGDNEYKTTLYFYEKTFRYEGYELYNSTTNEFKGAGTYKYKHPYVYFTEEGDHDVSIIGTITDYTMVAGLKKYTRAN